MNNKEITIEELSKKLGAKIERGRILKELYEANLPVGIWPLIKNIIDPKDD